MNKYYFFLLVLFSFSLNAVVKKNSTKTILTPELRSVKDLKEFVDELKKYIKKSKEFGQKFKEQEFLEKFIDATVKKHNRLIHDFVGNGAIDKHFERKSYTYIRLAKKILITAILAVNNVKYAKQLLHHIIFDIKDGYNAAEDVGRILSGRPGNGYISLWIYVINKLLIKELKAYDKKHEVKSS